MLWVGLTIVSLVSGCALTDPGRNWFTGKRSDQSEPDLEDDDWALNGKEGESLRPKESADFFDKYLTSDKAQQINRNFGIE